MPVNNFESESKLEDALKSLRRPNDCFQQSVRLEEALPRKPIFRTGQ